MDKNNLFIYSAFLLLVSCTAFEVEEPEVLNQGDGSLTKVTISASNSIDTKTTLVRDGNTSHYSVNFKSTDQLAVFGGSPSPNRFVISGEVNDYSAVDFEGSIEAGFDGSPVALYPFSEEASFESGKIRTTLPYLQEAVKNDFSLESNLSAGICISDPEVPGHFTLQLKNVCAIVKFTLPGSVSVSKVELKAKGGESISGDILITPGDEPSFTVLDGKDYVELVGSGMKSASYYIPVLPCTLEKGFSIKLYCEGLKRPFAEVSSNKTVTLKRSVILNLGTLNCTNEGGFAGSGTDEDPFIITSYTQLRRMHSLINEGKDLDQDDSFKSGFTQKKYKEASYYLACDIDCDHNNVGIGWDLESGCVRFQGHFDGGGHCISNYILNSQDDPSLGIFRYVQGAKIENLVASPYWIRTCDNNFRNLGVKQIGFIVGHVYSDVPEDVTEITNCKVIRDGDLSLLNESNCLAVLNVPVGGIVGMCIGNLKMKNCTNEAHILVWEDNFNTNCEVSVGGMVGMVYWTERTPCITEIDCCRNNGNIRKEYNDYYTREKVNEWEANGGGMVGKVQDGSPYDPVIRITNCVNTGNISLKCWRTDPLFGQDHFAGGMIGLCNSDGYKSNDPYIFNCLNTGNMYAYGNDAACGGMVGYNYSGDTHISLCVNTGSITGGGDTSDALGAISGQSETFHEMADCTECYFTNDPNMYSTGDGSCHNCWYYGAFSELGGKPLSGTFLNGRKSLVNSHSSDDAKKIWTNAQWANSAAWVGEAVHGGPCTLDIPAAGYSMAAVL